MDKWSIKAYLCPIVEIYVENYCIEHVSVIPHNFQKSGTLEANETITFHINNKQLNHNDRCKKTWLIFIICCYWCLSSIQIQLLLFQIISIMKYYSRNRDKAVSSRRIYDPLWRISCLLMCGNNSCGEVGFWIPTSNMNNRFL